MSNLDRRSTVHVAVMRHSLAEVAFALAAQEDVDELDDRGRSPLFYAAQDDNTEIVDLLIAHGADPTIRDKMGETSLHFAARAYQVETCDKLVKAGALIDAQDDYGNTALWRAVFESRGRGDVIRKLITLGADENKKNNNGISPRALAERIDNYNLIEFF